VAGASPSRVFDNEATLRALLRNVSDTIVVIDADGNVLWESGNPGGTLGRPPEYWRGRNGFEFIHPDDVEQMAVWLAELLEAPGSEVKGEYRIAAPGEAWVWVEGSAVNLLHDPLIGGIIITTRNIDDRKRYEAHLEALALHDPLTGLPNRTLLHDRLEHALARLDRRDATVAVLFCDLDRFKEINDQHGHAMGDDVIITFASRLADVIRPGDTVARFGGDEFVVLCEDVEGADDALAVAARIEAAVAEPFVVGESSFTLSTSIGVAVARGATDSPGALLLAADAAMYRAKEHGRSRVELYSAP
jgi:diguanylate cyclase (GGDEF)-like protein/PAS domain S-box-containing protein